MSDRGKSPSAHRRRRAVVYVRQSTLGQVERNIESAARQYALASGRSSWAGRPRRSRWSMRTPAARAPRARGGSGSRSWSPRSGSGMSGWSSRWRSRGWRARSADWHQLLDLCALTGTLIADADGIYSPADFNDRLLLGLKGTMSEAELHLIRARLDGGLRNKAERGELRHAPAGRARSRRRRPDRARRADEQVRHAIERVFVLWRRLGLGAADRRELIAEGQCCRAGASGSGASVGARELWRGARLPDQPSYAGRVRVRPHPPREALDARRATCGSTDVERADRGVVRLPAEHHPGYVSWSEYLATRERLRSNVRPRGDAPLADRQLARCGCGSCRRGRRSCAGGCGRRRTRRHRRGW